MSFVDKGELILGGRDFRVGSLELREYAIAVVSEIFTCATGVEEKCIVSESTLNVVESDSAMADLEILV